MAVIKKAEKVGNLLEKLNLPETVEITSSNILRQRHIRHLWARDFNNEMKNCLFEIFEQNMKEMYVQSSWGWDRDELWEEFFSPKSAYLLIVVDETQEIEAYSHFQVPTGFRLF